MIRYEKPEIERIDFAAMEAIAEVAGSGDDSTGSFIDDGGWGE